MCNLPCELESDRGITVVRITTASLTGPQMQEIAAELTVRMRYHSATVFIFDLARVEFLSSECLGMMVAFLQDVQYVHGKIALAGCGKNVAFLFRTTRLDSVFPLHEDVAEAQAALLAA